jgi:alpha-maltose-1-phosphate synthase
VYPHMGYEEKRKVQFDKPKIFAYRADVEELKEYLLKLLTDEKLRSQMGQAGRTHAENKFEYKKIAEKAANIIKERLPLT